MDICVLVCRYSISINLHTYAGTDRQIHTHTHTHTHTYTDTKNSTHAFTNKERYYSPQDLLLVSAYRKQSWITYPATHAQHTNSNYNTCRQPSFDSYQSHTYAARAHTRTHTHAHTHTHTHRQPHTRFHLQTKITLTTGSPPGVCIS